MPIVRKAQIEDLDGILLSLEAEHAEGMFSRLPFDRAKVSRLLAKFFLDSCSDDSIIVVAAKEGGKIVGHLLASVQEYKFCDERIASEWCWYVDIAHRGKLTGARMVKKLIELAHEIGVQEVVMTTGSGIPGRPEKLLELLGFEAVGTVYRGAR